MNREKAGFTRIELAAVLSIISLFALIAAPATARNKSQADVAACLDHNRQLGGAYVMFALDNNDAFATTMSMPMAETPGVQPWAVGYVDWNTSEGNTNIAYLTDPKYSVLADFLGRRKEPFKCPADVFLSSAQRARGWTERVRSVAGNAMLGWGADSIFAAAPEDPYIRARKFSDLVRPNPANTFTFIEEHPDSLNDCAYVGPGNSTNYLTWFDFPANYHNGAGMFAFADGRAELHAWRGVIRTVPTRYSFGSINPNEPGFPDQRWVFDRIPKRPN